MKNQQQEVLETCHEWLQADYSVELVTVVRTWGSSPRPPGSIAAVRDDGVLVGSVSGGCVEQQLSEQFKNVDLPQVHTHTINDEQAKRYGLACGGELELLFESLDSPDSVEALLSHLAQRKRVKRTVNLSSQHVTIEPADRTDVFHWDDQQMVQVFGSGHRVLLVGAGELSRYTATFALALDFEVVVVDPREHFLQAWSEPEVLLTGDSPDDAVLKYALDANSAVIALSHDPNIDDLALIEALPSEAFYVGALGSQRNYDKRCVRLLGLDVPDEAVARLRGPVGLDIGARSSAEIAISIVAELIQARVALT